MLLSLLAGDSGRKRYFSQYDQSLLTPLTLPAYLVSRKEKVEGEGEKKEKEGEGGKAKGGNNKDGVVAELKTKGVLASTTNAPPPLDAASLTPSFTSKKDPLIRRKELRSQILPQLLTLALTRTSLLSRSPHASLVLIELACVLGGGEGGEDSQAQLADALAELVTVEPSREEVWAQLEEMHAAAKAASMAGCECQWSGVEIITASISLLLNKSR